MLKTVIIIFGMFIYSIACNNLIGSEITYPVDFKQDNLKDDPELKSLEWNRYSNNNFVVLSIDNKQGILLSDRIELYNYWCTSRWGFPKTKFSKECRVFCVPNHSLLKKLFGLDNSKIEVRKKDGELEISVIWMVLNNDGFSEITGLLTMASFAEFDEQNGFATPWWFVNSAGIMNSSMGDIEKTMRAASLNKVFFSCEEVFKTSYDDYQSFSADKKKEFDECSLVLCLFLRKEFGEVKLHGFLKIVEKNSAESALQAVYGFKNLKEFEDKHTLYRNDLFREINMNKVPDIYYEIVSPKWRTK